MGTHKLRNSDALNGFIRYGNDPYIDFGTVSDILSFGAEGYTLDCINDNGMIAGHMRLNGATRAFTATPVPEPSAWLGLALAIVMLRRRAAS
ncbi:MAG: PEP-CTERM sorting domain-containing protein [Chthonomonas sp.]|nr:PEP-CTERM sorting domain-containing protein [Chthonomonas sp.]